MNARSMGLAGVMATTVLAACSDTPMAPPRVAAPGFALNTAAACGTTTTVNLELLATAGAIGTVQAWNDASDLHVTFAATRQSEWFMRESFVNVSASILSIPLNPIGAPKLTAFQYKSQHVPRVNTYEYVIPLAAVNGTPGSDLVIAAIGLLNRGVHTGIGYGDGAKINTPALHEYFVHTVQRCGTQPPPPPPPGKDIVVFNDINVFDAGAMADPNNVEMVQNLVNYTTTGPRSSATEVVWDRGRLARCGVTGNDECNDTNMATARSTIAGEGLTMVDIASSAGTLDDLIASQGANWKSIWLWTPLEAFTTEEVNALKQFADEGGRVVFIGEWLGYYPQSGIDLENQFLLDMGAVMTNTGGAVDCGRNLLTSTSLRPHQITTGLTGLSIACSSVLIPGPSDFPLYYDRTNTVVLSAVATIDVTPVSTTRVRPSVFARAAQAIPAGLKDTGSGR